MAQNVAPQDRAILHVTGMICDYIVIYALGSTAAWDFILTLDDTIDHIATTSSAVAAGLRTLLHFPLLYGETGLDVERVLCKACVFRVQELPTQLLFYEVHRHGLDHLFRHVIAVCVYPLFPRHRVLAFVVIWYMLQLRSRHTDPLRLVMLLYHYYV
ncbi:hypothetical protein BU16DRAFT_554124 [Lophium mytilinum]|uniref:Uncharacterized protein n=1 Tax=Lophium mytilinum TaxID=390894 RepID=A0A6A6RCF7_9PEZI|nr:hypothetical protein BU16DRAFT_554124 [Lophium mytilinum]